jgi:hypothetical protein
MEWGLIGDDCLSLGDIDEFKWKTTGNVGPILEFAHAWAVAARHDSRNRTAHPATY